MVRSLLGVVGISNEITLRTQAKLGDVTKRIEEALTRQAIREAQGIQVSIEGHTVKLRGKVHSWAERDAVLGVAWSASGVQSVVNELQLASEQHPDEQAGPLMANRKAVILALNAEH